MRALETEKSLGLRRGLCVPRTAGVAEIQEGLLWFFLWFFGRCGCGVSSLHCSQFVKQGLGTRVILQHAQFEFVSATPLPLKRSCSAATWPEVRQAAVPEAAANAAWSSQSQSEQLAK